MIVSIHVDAACRTCETEEPVEPVERVGGCYRFYCAECDENFVCAI